jgi:cyclic pyranopterin phosphate synthase
MVTPDDATAPVSDALGRPLSSLRSSVTDRCNLRCSYCMPEKSYTWLDKRELLDFEELARLVDAFIAAGVRRLRLTGGEPLLRRDLPTLVGMLADKPLEDVALTTNGLLLRDQAAALARAGLGRLTVSLDTLRPERFAALTRRDELLAVLAGIDAALDAGFGGSDASGSARLKLDSVVLRGVNDDEIVELLAFAARIGAELRFIEYMDVGGATRWSPAAVVGRGQILETIERALGAAAPLPGRGAAPAERFRLADGRTFGIIASTTAPFCRACDRSRITADGMWFHCLYATAGVDLKAPLRAGASDRELAEMLAAGWRARRDRGAEERAALPQRGSFVPLSVLRHRPHLEMHTRGG